YGRRYGSIEITFCLQITLNLVSRKFNHSGVQDAWCFTDILYFFSFITSVSGVEQVINREIERRIWSDFIGDIHLRIFFQLWINAVNIDISDQGLLIFQVLCRTTGSKK